VEKNILEIKNLKKTYHNQNGETDAIGNVSFDLCDKELLSIVGPSGCGNAHFTLKN